MHHNEGSYISKSRCAAIIKKIEFHMPVLRYGGRKAAVLDISNIEVEAVTRHTPQVPTICQHSYGCVLDCCLPLAPYAGWPLIVLPAPCPTVDVL